jgi:hypothetical protein
MATSLAGDFSQAHESRYFDFRYGKDIRSVPAIARSSDGFVDFLSREYFQAKFEYPIRVEVLRDRASFRKYVRKEYAVRNPPNFGIYFSSRRTFVTHAQSGLGTFFHEILHPLVMKNLPARPAAWRSHRSAPS